MGRNQDEAAEVRMAWKASKEKFPGFASNYVIFDYANVLTSFQAADAQKKVFIINSFTDVSPALLLYTFQVVLPPNSHACTYHKVAHLQAFIVDDELSELRRTAFEATSCLLPT